MIKISNATQKDLICICGLCDHEPFDPKCLFNQIVDKKNPAEEEYKRIMTLMKKEIAANTKKVKTNEQTKSKTKRK